nr:hypothetical protein [Tanacetum cinerariifolium]
MAYFVAILTPDNTWFCVMQCTLPTEGMRSIISMVSISLEGFLPSILLLVVILVAVVIVVVILVVVVIDAIVGVVIVVTGIGVVVVVMIIGIVIVVGVSFIIKLSLVIIVTFPSMLWGIPPMKASISFSVFGTMFGHKTANSWNLLTSGDPIGLFYSDRLSVCIPPRQGIIGQGISHGPVFLLGLSAFAMTAACASRAATTPFVISCRMVASVIAESSRTGLLPSGRDMIHNELSTSTKIDSSKRQSGVVDLTGDEDPSDEDGGIGMGDSTGVSVSLGEKTSMSKRYLVKLFEESGEMLLGKITIVILVRDKCPRGKVLPGGKTVWGKRVSFGRKACLVAMTIDAQHQAQKEMNLKIHRRREVFTEDDGWERASDFRI